ncbi:MAG: alanine dehydrogenase [Alphaproteobacteria bacterium]|nr:alanine dehydrogenase [Alphaproteobacteria bacterium]
MTVIGVPKEIKQGEFRVGLTPESVRDLTQAGHQIVVETTAGEGLHAADSIYEASGAVIAASAAEVFAQATLIVKVKEPQPAEVAMLRPHHTLFTYLHLAADRPLTEGLLASQCTAIAYESVPDANRGWPLLKPMSEIAGRLAPQMGASALSRHQGGAGVLLSGLDGVLPATVAIFGGGHVGRNAAMIAQGMGADVTVIDRQQSVLDGLRDASHGRISTLCVGGVSDGATQQQQDAVATLIAKSHMIIGAVLVPGRHAPRLLSRADLATMAPGTVLVDVAIDQGGCFETSKPTTHDNPNYVVDGIVHQCVANMPGAVPRTATYALNAVTAPFVHLLAQGTDRALRDNDALAAGVNLRHGQVIAPAIKEEFGL